MFGHQATAGFPVMNRPEILHNADTSIQAAEETLEIKKILRAANYALSSHEKTQEVKLMVSQKGERNDLFARVFSIWYLVFSDLTI
jgi:hypothetical protein